MNSQQKYYETHKEKCKQISKDWKAADFNNLATEYFGE